MKKNNFYFAIKIVDILDKKIKIGCKIKNWQGFENGNGEDVGSSIDVLIKEAKKYIKENETNIQN